MKKAQGFHKGFGFKWLRVKGDFMGIIEEHGNSGSGFVVPEKRLGLLRSGFKI